MYVFFYQVKKRSKAKSKTFCKKYNLVFLFLPSKKRLNALLRRSKYLLLLRKNKAFSQKPSVFELYALFGFTQCTYTPL